MSREDLRADSSRSVSLPELVPVEPALRRGRALGEGAEIEVAGVFTPVVPASAMGGTAGDAVAQRLTTQRGTTHNARFALAKFRPTTLPARLLTRPALLGRLEAGASQRLTVVVGSAGAGKSVLLSSWAATRDGGATSWLSCEEGDADPVRFGDGVIGAQRGVGRGFGG